MAAKLLHSLADDNPDLQKQIGCVNGTLQMLDRQNVLTGAHTTKHFLPAGNSHFRDDSLERESYRVQPRSSTLKYLNKNELDRQRVSRESCRPSFSSSSRSSSLSSLDCNRDNQLESASFERKIFPETALREPGMSLQNSTPQFSRKNVDLRNMVKDSVHRERAVPVDKYSDSPKIQSKFSDGGPSLDKRRRTPADIKESLRVLAKFQEAHCCQNEPRELLRSSSYHSKSGLSFSISKDAPRFSYDGREGNFVAFDPQDGPNATIKLKDLPRLSLDSRESSMWTNPNSNFLLESMQKDTGVVDSKVQSPQQTLPSNQARPPSVVAKLMGLETLPYSASSTESNMGSTKSYQDENFVDISSTFEKTCSGKEFQTSSSSKTLWKDPSSPRWRSLDGPMKTASRLPNEPAPWKQIDGTRVSQKQACKSTRVPVKDTTVAPSVYSEIEKRLKDLEFKQSGKDLRALKQILEAMQDKGLLGTPKEGEGSNFSNHKDHEQKLPSFTESRKPPTDQALAFTKRKALSAQNYESPIVIIKPSKLVDKSDVPAASIVSLKRSSGQSKLHVSDTIGNKKGLNSGRTSKDLICKSSLKDSALNSVNMKNGRTLQTTQTLAKSQQLAKVGTVGLGKTTGSISPRIQQKKNDMEKRSRPPTIPDSSKSRRQSNKQQAESNSFNGRRKLKHASSQQSDDEHLSEFSFELKNLSSLGVEDPPQSNETILYGSRNVEVANSEKEFTLMLSEEEAAEFGYVPPEYSSPVSVLDNVVYRSDSPSPIKYAGKTHKVDTSRNSNAMEQSSPESLKSISGDFTRKKLENIENLVEKLTRLNSSHDEARTDYIASLCENTNPDDRYVSEILLASGLLLRDLGSSLTDFQFHPSGYPINPDLFLVLEQTKASKMTSQKKTNEKFHRKLIFDAVNEILGRKLGRQPESWRGRMKLARKALNAQSLLKEVCSEIEGLQVKNPKCSSDEEAGGWKTILCSDVMHRTESWIEFDDQVSGAVLDVERLIFKDLVDEILRGKSSVRCKHC